MQITDRRRGAHTVGSSVDLEEVGAVDNRAAAVELDAGDADRLAGVEQGDPARVVRRHRHEVDRTAATVMRARCVVGLDLRVEAVQLRRTPSGASEVALPRVEVLARSPEGDAAVVRTAPAEDLRPGVAHEIVAVLLRFDGIVPVVTGFEEFHPPVEPEDRVVADIGRTRLQQAHRDRGVLGQPRRHHGTPGAAADDHVVVGLAHRRSSPSPDRSANQPVTPGRRFS